MKVHYLEKDTPVFCVPATSFPDGIIEAFQKLEKLNPSIGERPFYGISHMLRGTIVYKAAVAEMYPGEGDHYGCEPHMIPEGMYLTQTLFDFMKNTESITNAFHELLADPRMDQNFPCIEWYKSDREVMCMIKINP